MITAKEIIQEIKTALKQFGEYTYHDKGAHEVMDLSSIKQKMDDMTAEQIIQVLKEVQDNETVSTKPFLVDLIGNFDSEVTDRADELFESELFAEYY